MSEVLLGLLPFGGAKSGNNQLILGEEAHIPLLSALQSIMHSLRSRPYGTILKNATNRKRSRASASCCDPGTIDILVKEANDLKEREDEEGHTPRRKRTESASGSFVQQYFDVVKEHEECTELFGTMSRLSVSKTPDRKHFPFDDLPTDCKLKIFSFLSETEKGQSTFVCQEWNSLLRTSTLWRCINFNAIPQCINRKYKHVCGMSCYNLYRERMKKFLLFIQSIQPSLRRVTFSFDIGDNEDRWLDRLEGLLRASRCCDLACVNMNWVETLGKPIWGNHLPGSSEYTQQFRRRQRVFTKFFDAFTCNAPNISTLVLPFDWSSRSLDSLSRLTKLHSLVLEKYFHFQPLAQCSLDQLMRRLPGLRRLKLDAWTPSGKGLRLYSMESPQLDYLDVSQSRGFYIERLAMPELKVFNIKRHTYSGPLRCPHFNLNSIPCVLNVLRDGAPQLLQLNEHTLRPDWKMICYPELETVLKAVCSCSTHYKSDGFM